MTDPPGGSDFRIESVPRSRDNLLRRRGREGRPYRTPTPAGARHTVVGMLLACLIILAAPVLRGAFTDVATAAGLNAFPPPPFEEPFPAGLDRYTSGYATCAVDLDRDGWTDLIVSQNPRRCLVFMNNRDGTFREEGIQRGFESAVDIGGIAAGDFSNSGRTDVFMVPRHGPRYLLYVNDGDGRFSERAIERGADATVSGEPHKGQSVALVDFDRDGYLDIHVTEWGVLVQGDDERYAVLLRNRGIEAPGFFRNVTASSGVLQPHFGTVIHGYASAWADFDDDGYPDLALVNDFGKSQMWWNNGNGTFTEGRTASRVGTDQNGMGVAVADVDRDGKLDLLVTSFDFGSGESVRTPFGGNRLYRNRGGRVFEDVAAVSGVLDGGWAWGTAFLDADNNGLLDLIITNGYFYQPPPYTGIRPFPNQNPKTDRTKFYLRNELGFYDAADAWRVNDRDYGRGLAVLDFDNDGDEDVLIAQLYAPWILYRNDGPGGAAANRWLRLSFRGTASNRDGYGAVVRVTAGGATQTAVYAPTNAYLGQREPYLHFGLGGAERAEVVEVLWPNGARQRLENVPANQRVALVEPAQTTNTAPQITMHPTGGTFVKDAEVTLRVEASGVPAPAFTWFKNGVAVPGGVGASLRFRRLHPADAGSYSVVASNPLGTARSLEAVVQVTADPASRSAARWWNEALLDAIRKDTPNPPVHARNLYHLSAALWDAYWAYEPGAWSRGVPVFRREEPAVPAGEDARRRAQAEAMSHAAYRVIEARFARSPGVARTREGNLWLMRLLGFDPAVATTTGDTPAAVGNRIGAAVLAATLDDGANEANGYADATAYTSVNGPMIVRLPGTTVVDVNRWQPLSLSFSVTQNGIVLPSGLQRFVGVNARNTTPFALVKPTPTTLFVDPGPPPQWQGDRSERFIEEVVEVIRYSSMLDPADPTRVDISPGARFNNPLGTNAGTGRPVNPVTGQAYAPNAVNRADYARILAEYWADGPDSETPPGHWNVIFNQISDDPRSERKLAGVVASPSRLEWDVRGYLALNGALHDAACAAWLVKRQYDGNRPISMIRFLAGLGQRSDPALPRYDPRGLPLIPDLIEVTTTASVSPGGRHASVAQRRDVVDDVAGRIVFRAWLGNPVDPRTQVGGVGWVLGETWVPFQMETFVTPAFPGYVSGHSTFSRTAAEALTLLTGSPFFPGGLSSYRFAKDRFLLFELGPSEDVALQWATYYDAADQAGLSRLFGGIHVSSDDLVGRRLGARIGLEAYLKARGMREAGGQPPGLVNVSTRGVSGEGERVLIAGFVVGPGEEQEVLVRAVGPTLASFGVPAERVSADPRLAVFEAGRPGAVPVLTNDQWGEGPRAGAVATAARERGAFALPTGSRDAAELLRAIPGAYTVTAAAGVGGALPVQLVEAYGQRLINVSTRGYVTPGDGVLVAGFSLVAGESAAFLIRGVGPGLGALGVAGPLADPVIRVHRIGAGGVAETVAENDDWSGDAKASLAEVAATRVGAFPLTGATRDAALFVQLPPGSYTVTLSGKGAAEGVALVEVYHVR